MEKFKAVIASSTSHNESINEGIFNFHKLSQDDLKILNDFATLNRDYFRLEIRLDDGERYELPHSKIESTDTPTSCKISKLERPGVSTFITITGLKNSLNNELITSSKTIYFLGEFSAFSSRSCDILPLGTAIDYLQKKPASVETRNLVKDATGGKHLEHLDFWIPFNQPERSSDIYDCWIQHALYKTSILFCSEIWPDESGLKLVFIASQNLEIILRSDTPKTYDQNLIPEVANWILEVEREAGIRHTFLSARIANEHSKRNDSWPSLLSRVLKKAFNNARNDYKAHLHSKSADTLKAIGEIRKSIAEDSSKIVDRTHSLVSTLFRDIAIAVGTVSIKIMISNGSGNSRTETAMLLIFSAAWLAASLYFTIKTNYSYIISVAKSRFVWSRKVNTLIPISEFKELSSRPFKDSIKNYNHIRRLALCVYVTTIIFLLSMAASQLVHGATA